MARIFHPLLLILARATHAELATMIDCLKTENRILRSKLPKRVRLTPAERQRLGRRDKPLGRIMGELKKLGLQVSKGIVGKILKENGFDLGPHRGEGTWHEFLRMHAQTLWACDFFSKKVWAVGGLVE